MDEYEIPIVITAISDPEFEGLVSSALYSQGWSVVARNLDFSELQKSLESHNGRKLLVIYSTDLPGLNQIALAEITGEQVAIFGFSDGSGNNRGFSNISPRPKSPEELLLLILENARTPTGRAPLIHTPVKFSSKINVVGGVRHSTGTTTFSVNLAQEFALLDSRTLVIDANFQAPALASLLDLRHLSSETKWREVSQNLFAIEVTQKNIENFDLLIREAGEYFDQIVIDLGSVSHLVKDLTDRRWISRLKIWASRNADHFLVTSTSELLSQKSLEEFMQSASNLGFGSKLHLIKWQQSIKGQPHQKSTDKSPSLFGANWHLTWDHRACQAATAERTTLAQVSERTSLRKEIFAIAQEFVSKTSK